MRLPCTKLAGLGLIAIGVAAVRGPQAASRQYGLASTDAEALGFVRACGTRDITLGLILLTSPSQPLPLMLLSLLACADLATVAATNTKPPVSSLAAHAAGVVGAAALAIVAWKNTSKG